MDLNKCEGENINTIIITTVLLAISNVFILLAIVRSFKRTRGQALVHCSLDQLRDRTVRVLDSGPRQSYRPHSIIAVFE